MVPGLSNENSEEWGVVLILVTFIRRQCDIMKPFQCVENKTRQLGECYAEEALEKRMSL